MNTPRRRFWMTMLGAIGCAWILPKSKANPVTHVAKDGERDLIFKASDYQGKWTLNPEWVKAGPEATWFCTQDNKLYTLDNNTHTWNPVS